jgi:UDP:flavonoid glycosyltransferase YjiC (YdhE family)
LPAALLSGDASHPLVYVTLGSSGEGGALEAVLSGLAGLPIRGVLSTAGKPAPTQVPASFRLAEYVPGDMLVQHARFVVTNGGSASSYQALAAGVPVLGIPSNLDQYLTMQAITRVGAGLMLRSGTLTATEVRRAAVQLCDDVAIQRSAGELGRRFGELDCHERFQGWLEEFFRAAPAEVKS